jgi:hypothetical protein
MGVSTTQIYPTKVRYGSKCVNTKVKPIHKIYKNHNSVMDDARTLGEKNWRNAARNKDGWRKLLRKAWAQIGLLRQ